MHLCAVCLSLIQNIYSVLLMEVFLIQAFLFPILMCYVDLSYFAFLCGRPRQTEHFDERHMSAKDINEERWSAIITKNKGKRSLYLFFLSSKWGVLNYSFRERCLASQCYRNAIRANVLKKALGARTLTFSSTFIISSLPPPVFICL